MREAARCYPAQRVGNSSPGLVRVDRPMTAVGRRVGAGRESNLAFEVSSLTCTNAAAQQCDQPAVLPPLVVASPFVVQKGASTSCTHPSAPGNGRPRFGPGRKSAENSSRIGLVVHSCTNARKTLRECKIVQTDRTSGPGLKRSHSRRMSFWSQRIRISSACLLHLPNIVALDFQKCNDGAYKLFTN